ncbi:hypothetical protein AJ80_01152 [Polytolypa hystricis UAMH7299]|uniref:Mitochondrial fusion protein n=1 Tax=Polytolypa hystricis (strain UAMH7299) TaxID=1447883 RepID=A0A2B7Z0S3_POLH7|nr:hypothetical protein AJ80_01152 [Polytolypa hystricis UAMH7299]
MGSSEGPNPLRPYYVPPSIGLPSSLSQANNVSNAASSASQASIKSSARVLLPDFDYSDYLGDSSPSISDSIKDLLERALWRYSSVLMAQPFEVAKTILQVYVAHDAQEEVSRPDERRRRGHRYRENYYEEGLEQSSDDESSYFTSDAPMTPSPSVSARNRRSAQRITDRRGYIPPSASNKNSLKIKDPSALFDVLSQLWSTSGPTSLWKASNSTFVYSLLLPTLNTFLRSLISAILGFPEDGSLLDSDILTVSSPFTSLLLTCISSALSGVILSPIDTTRTYLILTPLSHGPRSLLRAIRRLPTPNYLIPPHLLPITVLSSTLPNLLTSSVPLFLKSYLSLDPVINPSAWGICTLLASGLELGIRFPLETVLRRAQIATFTSPAIRQKSLVLPSPTTPAKASPTTSEPEPTTVETIVPTPQSYRGVLGTIWGIAYEEGSSTPSDSESIDQMLGHAPRPGPSGANNKQLQKRRRGQGVQGLYRGWRLGMWAIVGVWGSGFLGAMVSSGDEEVLMSGSAAGRMSMGSSSARGGGGTSRAAF